jgi:RHS repeat-associated protein
MHDYHGGLVMRRFVCHAAVTIVTASLLVATPLAAHAKHGTPLAPAGAAPVTRPLPDSAAPNHGLPKGQRAPVVPPPVKAGGKAHKPTATEKATRAAAVKAQVTATSTVADLLLRSGFNLGDTSLVVYFNADIPEGDPTAFAQWWATVTDVESGVEQRSSTLDRTGLSSCREPRTWCRSFGSAEGWTLDPARQYTVTITVVQPDGTEATSPASNAAKPRTIVDPPAIPATQAAGCGCPTVLGPTVSAQALRGAQVNTGTGAFIRTERDFVMSSYGIPFQATRFYSSANTATGMFGAGWTWTYDAKVVAAANGSVRVRAEDGSEAVYTKAADGSYTRPAGIRSKLSTVAGGGWQLVTPDQRTLRFDAAGKLVTVRNARGFGVTLGYDASGLLTSVTDAAGRVARIENRTDLRLITKITLPDGRSTQFDYIGGRLLKVQDALGFTHSYSYDASGRLSQVTDARGNAQVRNEYGPDGRVTRQLDPLGAITIFTWDAAKQEASTTDPDGVVTFDGYRGNVLVYSQNGNSDVVNHRYDAGLRKGLVVDPKGNQEETNHDAEGNPTERTAPEPFSFTEVNGFDNHNNLTSRKDGRGNTWSYTFNEFNEMTGQKDPKQATGYVYEYDNRGLLTRSTDPRGKVTRYEYDAAGNRTAEISATGRRTEFTYDSTGRMMSIVDPRGTVAGGNRDAFRTRVVYDADSQVIERWQPGKSTPFRITYDELGNVTVQTDPLANSVHYTYDKASRLVETKNPRGDVTAITYTAAGRKKSVTDGAGGKTSWTYDAAGRVVTETSPRGNANQSQAALFTTTFHYDFNGNLIRADRPYGTDGTRVQVDTGFDALDRPTEQRDELNNATKVEYDNAGNVVGMTDENGEQLGYSYDEANRRTGGTGTAAAQIEYDEMGNPTRQTSPTGGTVTWQYDDDGRPVAVTEPRGNVSGADPAQFTTRYTYDAAGNPQTTTDPLGSVTRYAYDANDRLVGQTDANGHTTRYTYDDADRLTSVVGPDAANANQALSFKYNANGQVITRTDPLGRNTSMEYDQAGRLTVSTDPLGRRREYVYDPDSNLTELVTARIVEGDPRVDPNRPARTIFLGYDNLNRLTSKKLGTGGPTYAFGYDAKNRLVSLADPAGLQTRSYDKTDRLIEVARGDEQFRYEYDSGNNVTARVYPDGTRVEATFDDGDRITSLTAKNGGTSATYGFSYDVSDNLVRTTFPDSTGVVEDRSYDRAGRLTSVAGKKGDQVLAGYDLTLDAVGNPARVTTTKGAPGQPTVTQSTAYLYDAADRLTSVCFGAQSCAGTVAERTDYTYDLVGNRTQQRKVAPGENTTTAYTYDGADQLTREDTTGTVSSQRTFAYDLEGNQTRAGTDTYSYQIDHTMASATTGGQTTTYGYDAVGNRIAAASGTGTTAVSRTWSWDVNAPMPLLARETESGSAGTASRDYAYDGTGSPLALLAPGAGAATVHSYLRDWIGGVAGVVSPSGTPEWAYDYDPFGVARGTGLTDGGRKLTEDAPTNPLQYAGGYHDQTQGNRYHLGARNYDPGTGRFDAQDPAAGAPTETAVSSYAYANNQPTVLTDPSGMTAVAADGGGGGTSTSFGDPNGYAAYYSCMANPACRAQQEADQGAATGGDGYEDNPDYASAKKLVDEAGDFVKRIGDEIINLILDLVGFNDAKACVTEGDIVACISTALQAVPWGKLFKAAKVMIKAIGVGRRLVEAYGRLKAARRALESIPRFIKKAEKAADEAADSKKYANQVKDAVSDAKSAGDKAKDTARKARDGAKRKREANCNSFAAGTLVLMANGTTKAIEKLRPGDTVLSTDPQTGQTQPQPVTATITGTGEKHLVDLTLVGAGAGGGGPPSGDQVTATDGHPFWTVERGWVTAGDLRAGEHLRDEHGRPVRIAGVRTRTEHTTVHNLTVSDTHTYYVRTPGGTTALNHNDSLRTIAGSAESCPTGVHIKVKYKEGWSDAQRAAADAKVAALDDLAKQGKLVVTPVKRTTKPRTEWTKAGNSVDDAEDIDHLQDLQLGGKDTLGNMWPLDSSVNRSLGSQIGGFLRRNKLRKGTVITGISIS